MEFRGIQKTSVHLAVILFLLGSVAAQEYDFIIVGGGTAGCLLAARLSENPDCTVLLIEAGGEENVLMDIPAFPFILPHTPVDWAYRTVKNNSFCGSMQYGRCFYPRGRILGGTTVLNYMIYTRGNRNDYDTWEKMGNTGWGYDTLLTYFKKYENMQIPEFMNDTEYHSTKGELALNYPSVHTEAAKAFLEAVQQVGLKRLDYNAEDQLGFTYIQGTIKNGMRFSANSAFLKPVRHRRNLHIVTFGLVTKILIRKTDRRAYGVEYRWWYSRQVQVRARKEVIICAGAINSPQLLMLSGIGPKEHLMDMSIPVLQDSKVGYNLQEHLALGNLYFTLNQSVAIPFYNIPENIKGGIQYLLTRTGPFTITGGIEANGFVNLEDPDSGDADLELIFLGTTTAIDPVGYAWGVNLTINHQSYLPLEYMDAFQIAPAVLKPRSRGRILLKTTNPFDYPLIHPNYFSDRRDIDKVIKGVRLAQQIASAPALQKYGAKLYSKPLSTCADETFDSDEYWECSFRELPYSLIHHSGTCKMGPDSDPDAVVDPALKVRGIKGLRVVDGSIMPIVPAAHLMAPVYVVAEKAAHMIKSDWE